MEQIFRLFRFSGILGQPREVHPKFRNEIPENVCSIRSPTRNFRKFWSNGKRPWLLNRQCKICFAPSCQAIKKWTITVCRHFGERLLGSKVEVQWLSQRTFGQLLTVLK